MRACSSRRSPSQKRRPFSGLKPASTRPIVYFSAGRAVTPLTVHLQRPTKVLTSIKGSIEYVVVEKTKIITIDHVEQLHNCRFTVGGILYQFHGINNGYVDLTIIASSGLRSIEDFDLVRPSLFAGRPVVTDFQGTVLVGRPMASDHAYDSLEGLTEFAREHFEYFMPTEMHSSVSRKPAKMVWSVPTQLSKMKVPFELRNVPVEPV